MQADASSNEEDSAAYQTTASEEGAESLVAGRRDEHLAAHRLDLHPPRDTNAESSANVEELRGVAYIAAAPHHAGQSTESADGDDVVQFINGAAADLLDEATFASAALQSTTEHVRNLLDTPTAFASGIARQNHKSLDSNRASTHP